jgi:Response regulators consisting of a CheY-like receiver domain and a winged-helix DNA-binding domain
VGAPFILLVEDNPDDEELTLLSLRKRGITHEVVVMRDGAEAIDFLLCTGRHAGRDPSVLPTFVLLDLKLPKLDGIAVLGRIRSNPHTRHVPVVVLTSSGQESDVLASYQAGANSYVRKPVEFGAYMEAVGSVGAYCAQFNCAATAGGAVA